MSTAAPNPSHSESAAATTRAVLLIDADAVTRKVARRILETEGYAVTEASGGRDALAKLHDGVAVELVVTDLKMNDGSGGWLLAQLGYEFPALLSRTLVLSDDAHGAAAAHVAARWHCAVLAKPFAPADLVHALDLLTREG